MRPVGPQPPSVYWARRVLTIVVLIVIVALLVWFVGRLRGGGDGGGAPAPNPSTTPVVSPSPSPSPSPSSSKSNKPNKPSKSASATTSSASASTAKKCADDQIAVVASTDHDSYEVGASPKLRMRISNTSDTACLRDVGAPANELIVNQGSTRFWSSDDCSPGGDPDVVTLEPGESYSVTLTWPQVQSQPGCPSQATPTAATPGAYTLVGRNSNVYSSPAKFTIT